MIFGLLYFCVVILCVNRSRSSFILYRIVKRHSRPSNVKAVVAGPAGPASAGPLFWPNMLAAVSLFAVSAASVCLPVI